MSIKPEERIYDAAKKQHYFVWAISEHVSKVEPIFNRTIDYVERLETENAELRELVRDLYKRFHGVVLENWSYSTEDFDMLACRMRELGVEAE